MFLTAHATVAVIIAQRVPNPALAFCLGFISHYLLDAIPHGDDELLTHLKGRVYIVALAKIATVDCLIMLGWLSYLLRRGDIELTPATLAAVAGSILPDGLNGLYLLTKSRLIEWNHRINIWAHTALIKKPLPAQQGFAVQAIFFLAAAIYLIS